MILATWSLLEALQRNWALVVILSTVITLLVVPALIFAKYIRISLNIMRTTKPPLSRNPLDFARLVGEPVAFTAYDGLQLSGVLIRANPETPRRGMIVFAHEFCSDMYSCARYCRRLHEVGYDVFAFDFRGHGASENDEEYSPRQWVSDREIADMRGALAWVSEWLEQNGFSREIGLLGISRGAWGGGIWLRSGKRPRRRRRRPLARIRSLLPRGQMDHRRRWPLSRHRSRQPPPRILQWPRRPTRKGHRIPPGKDQIRSAEAARHSEVSRQVVRTPGGRQMSSRIKGNYRRPV